MTILERLKIELANKEYYTSEVYAMYLNENELDSTKIYDKSTMQRGLLQTVYDILQALSNDIDLFRRVETEFVNTSQAYKYLQERLNDVEKRINAIPQKDHDIQSNITFMFKS